MNLVSASLLRNVLYAISKLPTSNCMYSVEKFSQVLKVTGRVIWSMGVTAALRTILWKGG
jgi:hypothetical protein